MRQIKRLNNIFNRFKGLLIRKFIEKGSAYDDFSVGANVRQTLLHWGYELTENNFLIYSMKNELL